MSATTPVPSPTPPWARPVQSPATETLTGAGTISLVTDTTYLNSATPADAEDLLVPHAVVLPDGNYQRQYKSLFVPKAREQDGVLFRVSGTFMGFSTLLFDNGSDTDNSKTSAVLVWDGAAWHVVGGNAKQEAA